MPDTLGWCRFARSVVLPADRMRVGYGPERHTIEEEPCAPADHEILRVRGRPRESHSGRHVVGVGVDGVQELQVVAKAEIEREARRDTPLVLHVHADIRVRLRDDRIAERLCEAAVVANEEGGHRRERIVATERARVGDGIVVDHDVDSGSQRVRARLARERVHDLIHRVQAPGRAGGQRAERCDACDTDRGPDQIGRWCVQIAVDDLRPRLVDHLRRDRPRIAKPERVVHVVEPGRRAWRIQRAGAA